MTALLPARAASGSDMLGAWRVNSVNCVDALTLLAGLPDNSVDCVVTDPPYGIGKAEWDNLLQLDWISEARRVSKRLIVMTGNPELIAVGHTIGDVKNCIVLHARNGMTRGKVGFGNWFAALVCGEWDWQARPNFIPYNVRITEKIPHPSPKPLEAMKKLISYYIDPRWLVLDPFAGSGTTAVAARNLGRRYITGDISPEYCAIAERRLALPYTPMFAGLAG